MSYRGGTDVEGHAVLLDQKQCWLTRDCLVTALGNLLIFPINMYLTNVAVSVFDFAIILESLLSSSWLSV